MPDSAVVAANKAKSLNDENLDAYTILAQSQLALKNNPDAYSAARAGLKVKKDFEPLVRTLGQVYLAMDSADAATVTFTKAQDLDANDKYVYTGLGDAYLKAGVTALTITNYQKSLELDSTQADVWFKLARTHMKERQWNDAAEAFQKGLVQDPNNDAAYLELGDMYYRAKYWPFAVKWLGPYVKKHPEARNIAMKYVESLFLSRQYKQFIPEAEKLLKDSSNTASLLRMLGYANAETKNYDAAIKYYTTLEKVDTLKADDWRKLGMSYFETKRDSLAAYAIEQILKTDTANSALYSEAGAIYMRMKSWSKAAALFLRRFQSDPTNFSAIFNYAACSAASGDFDQAADAYTKATGLRPDYAGSYYNLGTCYLQLKKWPEAKKSFEDFVALADTAKTKNVKELANANKFIGLVYLVDKKYEDAVKYEKKSLSYDDNDSDAHTWLGQAYHNLQSNDNYPNAREDAIKEYKKALKINPNSKEARKYLEMLEPQ
jgi:tetratricopeptide (TPR) repeat protein